MMMNLYPSDIELWNAFRKGDREAFGRIYHLNIQELLSYGYRITTNRQLIRDSIHDLFLHLWMHRERLSETDSVKYYLFRALRNRIIQNKQEFPEALGDVRDDSVMHTLFAEMSWEESLIAHEAAEEQIRQLKQAINKLPARQQEVIQLRYFHEFELNQIACVMQVNNQSVRNLLHRAIVQLRGFIEIAGPAILLLIKFFV